jgi:hypothetical protein
LTLPYDPIEDANYLAALVAGQRVSAIACERPGSAQVFYARALDELKEWAEGVRKGAVNVAAALVGLVATSGCVTTGLGASPRLDEGRRGRGPAPT